MGITAASLVVTDVLLTVLTLVTEFNTITRKMQAEERTELTPEEWARITSRRKDAIALMMAQD